MQAKRQFRLDVMRAFYYLGFAHICTSHTNRGFDMTRFELGVNGDATKARAECIARGMRVLAIAPPRFVSTETVVYVTDTGVRRVRAWFNETQHASHGPDLIWWRKHDVTR